MARAYKIEDFNRLMQDMDSIDKRVRGYLFQVGYEKWSIVRSTANRSMMMTSNIAESFNARNREAKELPIMSLLDYMMNLVMEWNNTNRMTAMSTFTGLEKKYNEVLKENSYLSQKMMVKPSTDYVYVVVDAEQRQNIVCMQKQRMLVQTISSGWDSLSICYGSIGLHTRGSTRILFCLLHQGIIQEDI
uniref:Uncharacterized protein n=1 Tax=Nicotiana tabacum TaxID=4097 RepID=A0A1S4B5U2_TOBAC|nr:PREDICTED: uncharacterized protein LOC107804819 [Nicotiana tabacum]